MRGFTCGPITRAAQDVLRALLWQFHNARSGCCCPSYERIGEAAGCSRSTAALALRALEFAGVLTWVNRIVRVRELVTDLFGKPTWIWRVVRTSNAYVLCDPGSKYKSENRGGTQNQEIQTLPMAALPGNDTARSALATLAERARWSVPLPDSAQPWQQRQASNKAPPARTEPHNTGGAAGMTKGWRPAFELEAEARAVNAQPWEPLPGMVKRQCDWCRCFGLSAALFVSGRRRATPRCRVITGPSWS
jgi:hypothetical protein